ncbi:hypothetical protein Oscil6304_1584 [Oscillatoria acuminata PCC 6304]|uniref:Uncharacterized protein n=1 Tax=Oscillatoria acuminata PCC 6304 TaxID=56110 RepID=K9TGP8_9CYAN|nr:hypothetical protein Oscil6304_1584 [Oscillatoria acuminata PCC 6304]
MKLIFTYIGSQENLFWGVSLFLHQDLGKIRFLKRGLFYR